MGATKKKRARSTEQVEAMGLRALRNHVAKTQVEVAGASGIPQGEVSILEHRETLANVRLQTLRRYVEALGGRLELVAVLGTERIEIDG